MAVRCDAALRCAVLSCAVQADKEIGAVKVSRLNMVDLAGSEKTTKVCGCRNISLATMLQHSATRSSALRSTAGSALDVQ